MLIRGLLQRYREDEEFLVNFWNGVIKISQLKELLPEEDEKKFNDKLKEEERKERKFRRESGVRQTDVGRNSTLMTPRYSYGQEIYCDKIMRNKIEIKMNTLEYLDLVMEDIFLVSKKIPLLKLSDSNFLFNKIYRNITHTLRIESIYQ